MVKKKLVEELISDGAKLLRELDCKSFPVESMFWIHMPDEDYWRLVIGSPIVTDRGSAAAYGRLGELLQGLDLAGVTLEDISLLDPASQQFKSLLSQASASSRLAAGPAWDEFEDSIFYRWTSASVSGELTCQVGCEQLKRFWESERKKSGDPALLVDLDGRRVTLRFHPQHGNLGGIEGIKRAFALALHRPDARPDCQIHWLN
jgi:hypothetical protein